MEKKLQHGFSLLELACLMLLMGLVGLAAVPSMKQVKRQESKQIAKTLCLDLAQMKTEFDRNTGYKLKFELTVAGGKVTGYEIFKTVGATDVSMVKRSCNEAIRIIILDENGNTPATRIEAFEAEEGKIKFGAAESDEIQFRLKAGDSVTDTEDSDGKTLQNIKFNMMTGYYTISA